MELTQPIVQYPTDLVFALLDTDVSSQLTVLQTQSLQLGHYDIEFAIIGESHCITVSYCQQLILQEVLACTDMSQIVQAQSHKFAKLEPYCITQPGYQSRVWFADGLAATVWIPQQSTKLEFPEIFQQTPFTEIGWQVVEQSIHWRTTHVYPLETHTTYVYSETFFDLIERSTNE